MAQFDSVYIPYGGYWSTPFVRWQGNFSHLHPIHFAADVAKNALRARDMAPEIFDALFLGMTVIAEHSFYGAPWLAGLIGAALPHEKSAFVLFTRSIVSKYFPTLQQDHLFAHIPLQKARKLLSCVH